MNRWVKRAALACFCLAVLAVGSVEARDREENLVLEFTTFPCEGMGDLFGRILTEAYGRIGYDVHMLKVPAERGLVMADEGYSDGLDARGLAIEQYVSRLVRVPTPLYTSSVVAVTRQKVLDVSTGLKALKPYTVGIVLGHKSLEEMTEGYSRVLAACYGQLFAMLDNDRIDVAVVEELDARLVLKKLRLRNARILLPPLGRIPMYHYLNRKHSALVPLIDEVLREMEAEGRLAALLEQVRSAEGVAGALQCFTQHN